MASRDLDIAKWDSRVEGRHDERGPKHVGMDDPEPSLLSDRADPAMGGPAIKASAVLPPENGTLGAFPDDQVDGPSRSRDERDHGWLVSFTQDPECPVPTIEGDVLDVRPARLAYPEAVQPEEDGEGRMIPVEPFRRVEEGAELPTVQTPAL